MIPSECQELVYPRRTELGTQWLMWCITEEQNWVPSNSSGISQENRTGFPVNHLVYPRRTELGTQWLTWYIPEEQNWLSTPLWYIPEELNPKCQHSVIINYFDIALLKVDWSVFNKRKKLEAGRWWDAVFKLAHINNAKENRNCTSSHCCAVLIFQASV